MLVCLVCLRFVCFCVCLFLRLFAYLISSGVVCLTFVNLLVNLLNWVVVCVCLHVCFLGRCF